MKKNAMLKIAAVLLVAVLLTTCAISSTFAKYVSGADDFNRVARVAKWGVTSVTTTSGNLFDKSYVTGDNKAIIDTQADLYLLAPGTSGSIVITNNLTGTPEVSGIVDYTCTADADTGCVASDDLLDRINLTIQTQKGSVVSEKKNVDTVDDLVAAINNLDTKFDPNASLDEEDIIITIEWNWPIGTSTTEDTADTNLGNYAANEGDILLAIRYTCDIYQTGPAGAADGQ